ncbi:MAG: hypothetical protein ABI612_18850 [Betaproteobacteria bacterium]
MRRLRPYTLSALLIYAGLLGAATALAAEQPVQLTQRTVGLERTPAADESPIADLKFKDFFKMPIGPRGLEPSDYLLSLDRKRVHLMGYMARQDEPQPGLFILAPLFVNMPEHADGPADDLPPAIVFVHMPESQRADFVRYTPGLLSLTGVLSVGPVEEADGRVSAVRLLLSPRAESTNEPQTARMRMP